MRIHPGACLRVGLAALTSGALCAAAAAQAVALDVQARGQKAHYLDDRPTAGNEVKAESRSTLEDFTVISKKISGTCTFDPGNVATLRGKLSVKVADLDTGIDLRNEHLRGPDWLDAANHPLVTVEITGVEDVAKIGPDEARVTLVCSITIKGRTGKSRIPAILRYLDESPATQRLVKGDLLRIRTDGWKLRLSDYGVTGPPGSDFVGLKVADEIEIRASVMGSTQKPPDAIDADREAPKGDVKPPPPPPKKPG